LTPLDGCVSLVAITPASTRPSVFAVGDLDGGVIEFSDLARAMSPEQGFYALRSVGLDGKREPLDSVEATARHYLSEIRSVQPRGPYALIGWRYGASVAYEMARRLAEAGDEVAFLGLLDPARKPGVRERVAHAGGTLRMLLRRASGHTSHERVGRELDVMKVRDANMTALQRFERKPFSRRVNLIAVFEPNHRAPRPESDWETGSGSEVVRHVVAGDDSQHMLKGENARALAAGLEVPLKRALERK